MSRIRSWGLELSNLDLELRWPLNSAAEAHSKNRHTCISVSFLKCMHRKSAYVAVGVGRHSDCSTCSRSIVTWMLGLPGTDHLLIKPSCRAALKSSILNSRANKQQQV